jgi:hypothetical protein
MGFDVVALHTTRGDGEWHLTADGALDNDIHFGHSALPGVRVRFPVAWA